jgi:hypothetical protein
VALAEWQQWSKYRKHIRKLWYSSTPKVFHPETKPDTILSPYFVGVYLGDGHTHTIAVTTMDEEIRDIVYSEAGKFAGAKIRISNNGSIANSYHITLGRRKTANPVSTEFRKLGLIFSNTKLRTKCGEKFIPEVYQTADVDTRIELLSGLIDSDGHMCAESGLYELSSKSKKLVQGISRMAIGLGIRVAINSSVNKDNGVTYYRIHLSGVGTEILRPRLCRKIYSHKHSNPAQHVHGNTGFTVNPVGEGKYNGFTVEGGLYITNGGMITHNSGKSLIIYSLLRWHTHHNRKCLVIVPTTQLVSQLYSDFEDYSTLNGWSTSENCNKVMAGLSKDATKNILISTWQSLQKLPKSYFEQFDVVFSDECHLAAAKTLTGILEKCSNATYRIGTTGTLDGSKTNEMVLQGLIGPITKVTTTKELMDNDQLSALDITCLTLKYSDADRKAMKKTSYKEEIDWLIGHPIRNKFVVNLSLSLTGNTLVLFQYVEKQGKILYEMAKERAAAGRKIFFIYGGVGADDREAIRMIMEQEQDAVIYASVQTTSTGVNFKNLHNIVFPSPTKSRVRSLQSIGRGLRKANGKTVCRLFDIGDDLTWKTCQNHTYKHMIERLKFFNEESFQYKNVSVDITT